MAGVWEEITCIFCDKGVMEMEWNFGMECETYKDIHIQYENNLKFDNVHHIFDKDKINQIASLLVKTRNSLLFKTHSRISDIERNMNMS